MADIDDLAVQLANDTGYSIGNQLFKGNLPPVPDNAIALIKNRGMQPNRYLPEYSPMFQVLIRDDSYSHGETMLKKVRDSLQRKDNVQLGSTFFQYILVVAEGGWIHRDESGRDMWSINFQCQTR